MFSGGGGAGGGFRFLLFVSQKKRAAGGVGKRVHSFGVFASFARLSRLREGRGRFDKVTLN